MKPDGPLHAALRRLIGSEHVPAADARSPYNSDASNRRELRGRADAVVLPGSAREVEAVVRWCYAHDVAIVPRGGGTGLTGGAVPTDGGVVLSLERLRAVRELEAGLWRMLPEAGVSTRDVQRLARENGLFFGPDPGAAEQSQIGGNVATNAGGPHALKYGVTGAWVTGLEAVLAPGELVHIGGWASKDVAGYDVKDLLIGSEGTLGVITAVRLRLLPARAAQITQVAFFATRAQGCAAMLAVPAAGIEAAAMDFADGAALAHVAGGYPGEVPSGAGFALLIEVDGTHEQACAQADDLDDLLGGDALAIDRAPDASALWGWREGFNGVLSGVRGAKVSEDVSFPVERLQEGLERFEQLAAARGLSACAFGHGGDGNVHATVLVDPADEAELQRARELGAELFVLVGELGGSIAAEHGVGWLKRGLLESQWDERTLALHEQIKRAFDPKGLMNPGKKLARVPSAAS
jgi:glycolate oxidase subunit GlcD